MRDFRVAHGATELLLIRHAQAKGIAPSEAIELKDIDLPLTPKERMQVGLLARRLRQRDIAATYSSPLRRTREEIRRLRSFARDEQSG